MSDYSHLPEPMAKVCEALDEAAATVFVFASHIKSGSHWSESCEEMLTNVRNNSSAARAYRPAERENHNAQVEAAIATIRAAENAAYERAELAVHSLWRAKGNEVLLEAKAAIRALKTTPNRRPSR